MRVWSTTPATDYDAVNPGTVMVGFEYTVPADSKETFEVLLVPEKPIDSAGFLNKTLQEW
ncbi:hypothetical protein SDC9_104582 [bioreactor metagenome]|uniref:Uncharacterized protein n=1 Tax=bioreactor metagenome TaxID=1076179 RepID=A0A645AXD6_9ZZZZ